MKRVPVTFTKKTNKSFSEVPGTIVSVHNRLLLASTGIPSLDSVIGGGLPVGSVLLVEEDVHRRFSDILLKYFLAEGVVCSHGLYVSSAHTNPDHILDNLPKPCSAPSNTSSVQGKGADMKIAFMYQDLPESKNLVSGVSKYGHYYDISSTMDKSSLLNCDIKTLDMTESLSRKEEKGDIFRNTLKDLKQHIEGSNYQAPGNISATPSNVLRIAIPNLGSPLWCDCNTEGIHKISRYLHCLRALARSSLLVCLVTMPMHIYSKHEVAMFRQLVDCSVQLEAFVGEKNPLFKEYHGLFKVHKLPCLNALVSFVPESFDLAFEMKRTKFVIECLHLPPDISETASRQGMDEAANQLSKSTTCDGVSLNNKLDF